MANIPMFDPLSTEVRSPLIAGLTEACSKLSSSLNLKTVQAVDLHLVPIHVSDEDQYRIYQAPLGNKLWLESPAPVIKKNGAVITPVTDEFTIDYIGGSIAFENNKQLEASDEITVDVTYITGNSETINSLTTKLEEISNHANQFKGYFDTLSSLQSDIGDGIAGDYAIIGGEDNTIYIWNSTSKKWINILEEIDLTNYYTKTETDTLVNNLRFSMGDLVDQIEEKGLPRGGTTNQVLSKKTDSDYDVEWVQGHSNENIFDNSRWDAKENIINQRGQDEYTGNGYTIDRWRTETNIATVTILTNGIRVVASVNNFNPNIFGQICEVLPSAGSKITYSVLVNNVNAQFALVVRIYNNENTIILNNAYRFTSNGIQSITVTVPEGASLINCTVRAHNGSVQGIIELGAAKLELGTQQTLAHKEGDEWVLNDPPPNKALELAKCMRYQIVSNWMVGKHLSGYGYTSNTTTADVFFPVPVQMRAAPTISSEDGNNWSVRINGQSIKPATIRAWSYGENCIMLRITGTFPEANTPFTINSDSGTLVIFDANL